MASLSTRITATAQRINHEFGSRKHLTRDTVRDAADTLVERLDDAAVFGAVCTTPELGRATIPTTDAPQTLAEAARDILATHVEAQLWTALA